MKRNEIRDTASADGEQNGTPGSAGPTTSIKIIKVRHPGGDDHPQAPAGDERPRPRSRLEDDEPWVEPVEGAALLNEIAAEINRYVVLPSAEHADAIALWAVHSFTIEVATLSPILGITSPEKRCGKSTLMTLLNALCRRAISTANISPAVIYRFIERYHPTLLIDEADTFMDDNEALRGILNAGHARSTSTVMRCVGSDHEPTAFSCFGAKAVARISELPDTLRDRAIPLTLARKKPDEEVARIRLDRIDQQLEPLRRRCVRWYNDNTDRIVSADPHVPEELNDRAQDNWRPLVAIADIAGADWPERARRAAVLLSSDHEVDDPSLGVQLLSDIRAVFENRQTEKINSEHLVNALIGLRDRPWNDVGKGKPLTPRTLVVMLQQFRIRPRKMRIEGQSVRGYERSDFRDAFERYTTRETSVPEPFHIIRR